MTPSFNFGGTHLELHPGGLLWMPEHRLLCASDLHFEKGSFYQRFATLLPPYDTRATLLKLAAAIDRFRPERFISLGDSFHDVHAASRMEVEDRVLLHGLIHRVREWMWVEGNHDPAISADIPGNRCAEYRLNTLIFRHIQQPASSGHEVSGHYHPKVKLSIRRQSITRPCFVRMKHKLIMPAFGAYTGGLYVDSPAFLEAIASQPCQIYVSREMEMETV